MRRSGVAAILLILGSAEGAVRVGIVFDAGGKDDKSFNWMTWQGALRAKKEFGIIVNDVEPRDASQIEPAMRMFASRGFDLIVGVGYGAEPYIRRVAKEFPDKKFAIVDVFVDMPNVVSLTFKEHEGCFLVGMMAGMLTKTNKIGFIGGADIPLIRKFALGFKEGARYVNPGIEVLENFVGTGLDGWTNPAKAKELALAQIARGADIIFAGAGQSSDGILDAVVEKKKFAICTDANQNYRKPGYILTSMLKRVDNAVYQVIRNVVDGEFKGGRKVFGLENDGIGYAIDKYNRDLIPRSVIQAVERAKKDILAGKIRVPDYTKLKK